ncbi:MAG TPA: hypothetical protein VG347_13985 [Verrucomicrobiae bacterium]|nr:hypothetical protein [Verrucomicrobiae bacterium]
MRSNHLLLALAFGVCLAGGLGHFLATGGKKVAEAPALASPFHAPVKTVAHAETVPVADAPPTTDAEKFQALLAADPADVDGQAAGLLDELCRAGKFEAAFKLVGEAPAELHAEFFEIIFSRWAQARPQDAVQALAAITDATEHSAALRAAADSWNLNGAGGLATYAIGLPAGKDRDYALGLALDNWSLQDPTALATWLNTLPPGEEFDYGAAMMIARTDGANRTPELALKWVENINAPSVRYDSFLRVLAEWKQTDPAAAQQYVANAPWLEQSQRQAATAYLSTTRQDTPQE